jgi:DNA-binding transcriptional regulator/RsmH inhibitor MraZ
LLFIANDVGADAEIDGQGRLLLPSELRRALKLDNDQVRLKYYRRCISFSSSAVYEEERRQALEQAQEALPYYEDLGVL